MQVGRTKGQSLYNKPSAVMHPGALAAGTLPQYNTIPEIFLILRRTERDMIKKCILVFTSFLSDFNQT